VIIGRWRRRRKTRGKNKEEMGRWKRMKAAKSGILREGQCLRKEVRS